MVAQVDVENRNVRPVGVDRADRVADTACGRDVARAQSAKDVLGIERDDQAVLDQQHAKIGQKVAADRHRLLLLVGIDQRRSAHFACDGQVLRRDGEAGDEPGLGVIDLGDPAQVIGHRALDDRRAEPPARRRADDRTAALDPVKFKVVAGVAEPADDDLARVRQAAVLG